MSEYKAVVVSCAGRGKAHLQAYEFIENARAVACCDIREDRREALVAELGVTGYADAAEMIRTEKPDIVHLATNPTTRVELMTLVSELGVPLCTVEKPIAVNVPDWRALCELEKTSKTKFAVCHQFRWQPHLVKCQQAVLAGQARRHADAAHVGGHEHHRPGHAHAELRAFGHRRPEGHAGLRQHFRLGQARRRRTRPRRAASPN